MSNSRKIGTRRARRLGLIGAAAMAAAGLATAGVVVAGGTAGASQFFETSVANDTLTINGTNGIEVLSILPSATDANALLLDIGANGTVDETFDRSTFSHINVNLKGSDDSFFEQAGAFADEQLTVDGGLGDDSIITGDGNDTVFGSKGNDRIRTGAGNDTIFAGAGNDDVDGERGTDFENLGTGDDLALWVPGEGNDTIDGGPGADRLDFLGANAAEVMALSAEGRHAIFTRNLANIRMDMVDTEAITVHALGDVDQLTVNDMRTTDIRDATLDLNGAAGRDGAVDQVIVNGSRKPDTVQVSGTDQVDVTGLKPTVHISGHETTDQLLVKTLDGNDRVTVDPQVSTVLGVTVDLGVGQLPAA